MPMSEFDLIQISSRFRKLEELIEAARVWLMTIDCNSDGMEKINNVHIGLDICADACRDDMVTMQESIRGRK